MLAFLKNLFQSKKFNAAQSWQQLGNDTQSAYWLYATPVHLLLQRDTFSLAAPVPLTLSNDESDALTTLFNKHFEGDGMHFVWHQNQWFLRLAHNPNIQTHAPQAALNKAVDAYLPTGEGATQWAAFTNEVQMLLFEHAVNQAREAKRLPIINSIWCYGLGKI